MTRPQNLSRARAPAAWGATALAVAAFLASPCAEAQQGRDPVAAGALFKEARALVDKGDYAAGCPKLQAAFDLDPTASTLINVARCHEHDGKVATASADYARAQVLNRETAGAERQKALAEVIQKAQAALGPRIPRMRISVASPPPGLRVTRDGIDLPIATFGVALPLDPGQHTVEASAPGFAPQSRKVALEEGKTASVDLTLVPLGAAPPPPPVVAPIPPAPRPAPPPVSPAPSPAIVASPAPDQPAHTKGGVPTWAWVTGAGGVVLVGAGVYFLIDNQSALGALHTNCPTANGITRCTPGYDYAADNSRKDRDVPLYVGLGGVGLAAVGVAVWGIATAPKKSRVRADAPLHLTPVIGRSRSGLVLEGGF